MAKAFKASFTCVAGSVRASAIESALDQPGVLTGYQTLIDELLMSPAVA